MSEPPLAPHQLEAVTRALELLRRHRGLLLADDVGLGKSFVAAAVMTRFEGELELVVPASLVAQWKETCASFSVSPRILTHDGLAGAPFFPDGAARLVVVDEAHAFRNPATRRYRALARRSVGARLLLVTATPLCNALRDLESLIRLIARDDLLAEAGVPSIDVAFERRDAAAIARVVSELVIRRDASVLPVTLQFGALARRVIHHSVPAIPQIDRLRFPLVGETALLRRFLLRRLESSEAALLESVRRQLRFYERALSAISAGRALPKRDYRRVFGQEEDRSAFQEVLFWELFAPPGRVDPQEIREEMARLDAIAAAAAALPPVKRALLEAVLAEEETPALISTGAAATAQDLHAALSSTHRVGLVTSRERSRELSLARFRAGRLDVLVMTDMAAEGLNLQRAGLVVHYDIPWNPVKLDQRNGRAYRIGQRRNQVRAVYFLPQSRAGGVMRVVARKTRMTRRTWRAASVDASRTSTMRPRLAPSAAFLRLRAAAGRDLPDALARRQKAGVEMLMEEMSREFLDAARLEWLIGIVEGEVR